MKCGGCDQQLVRYRGDDPDAPLQHPATLKSVFCDVLREQVERERAAEDAARDLNARLREEADW